MEGTGPEAVKRPRLDSYGARIQQQAPEASSHNYPGPALPPPSAYNQHLPLSPYHDPVSEHRSLPEPPHHVNFTQSHSGYTTPIRDIRAFPSEPTYSRNESASAPTRSPDDIQQLAQLRPLNTTSANEGYHYQPHSHPETTRGPSGYITHDGVPNGTLHSLAMANQNEPVSAPPFQGHPGSIPNTPMGNGPSIHGNGGQFNPPQIMPWMPRPAKKHTRATQACDTCRTRKAKCDEGKPVCGYCQENGLPCNYKEVAPAKADRAQKEIMDRLKASEEKIDRLQVTLERFIATAHGLRSLEYEPKDREPDLMSIPQHVDSRSPERKPGRDSDGTSRQSSTEFEQEQHIGRQVTALPSPPVRIPLELSFSIVEIDHTTAAHKLLRWPSIRNLLRQRPVNEDYVMQFEERKGLLRIYGRGQGNESLDESQTLPSSPATSSSSGRSDELIRYQAALPHGLWGTGVFTPPTPPDAKSWGKEHPGGLDANGSLKMDNQTMFRLHQSYLNNIHIMHPFLDKKMLSRLFERFMRSKSSSAPSNRASPFIPHGHVADTFRDSPPGFTSANKRKFSGGPSMGSPSDAGAGANQPLERCISTAIVLLVMALGKISEHTEPLPGPVPDNPKKMPMNAPRSYSPLSYESPPSVKPSPASSSSAYTARSPMSDIRGHPCSRGPSEEHSSSQNAPKPDKNVDVIPGLAYFAHATDILGNQHGGHDLAHVQANLLAGLYMGQLACTFESLSWIRSACLICHHIVRDPTLKTERDEARKDSIRFAYYTCLQLESDILAELDLQSARIDRAEHQDFVAYPKGVTEDVTDLGNLNDAGAKVLAYYSSQIYLRRMLNKIQLALYPTGITNGRIPLSIRDECQEMLTNWRRVLPPEMRWADGDDPSEDINEARLRAKYYGALYIIHRPFLHYALHSPDFVNASDMVEGAADSLKRTEREQGAMPPPALTAHDRAEIMRSAQLCVEAASYSTVAFDGICSKRRLIVTNIFGTAHAQFGNCLVLAATHTSHLSKLVNRYNIIGLIERTIDFLRRLRYISGTLWEDARILECVAQVVRNEGKQSSSFSSTTG